MTEENTAAKYESTFKNLKEVLWGDYGHEPEMVFSVIGDSDTFVPKPWPKPVFQLALMDAASNAGASSIFFCGGETDISEMIRKGYEEFMNFSICKKNKEKNAKSKQHKRSSRRQANGNDTQSRGIELLEVKRDKKQKSVYIQRYKENIHQEDRKQENSEEEYRKGNRDERREEENRDENREENREQENKMQERLFKEECRRKKDFRRYLLQLEGTISNMFMTYSITQTDDNDVLNETVAAALADEMRVPILLVVLEGDMDTIKHVAQALQQTLPVLIIKGSGKAADLIVDYFKDETVLKSKAAVLFGQSFTHDQFIILERHMEEIKERASLISVFDVDEDDPKKMSHLAGDAVIRAWSLSDVLNHGQKHDNTTKSEVEHTHIEGSHSTPRLAKTGKRHSIVRKVGSKDKLPKNIDLFFTPSEYTTPTSFPLYFYLQYQILQTKCNFKSSSARNLLFSALVTNRSDYVEVLLNHDVRLPEELLLKLYKKTFCKCFKKECCFHIAWILENITNDMASELMDYTNVPEDSNNPKQHSNENGDTCTKWSHKTVQRILGYKRTLVCCHSKEKDQNRSLMCCHCKVVDQNSKTEDGNQNEIMNLLLWALIVNRKEIAFTLWQRTEHPLLTALMSSVILQKLQKRAALMNEHQLCAEIRAHAEFYENRGLLLMDEMNDFNQKAAMKSIETPGNAWNIETSPLSFAHRHMMYNVVAHPCSQKNLNKRWYNDLPHVFLSVIKEGWFIKMVSAPLTKFICQQAIFLGILLLFSHFVLTGINAPLYTFSRATFMEYMCFCWFSIEFLQSCKTALDVVTSTGKSVRSFCNGLRKFIWTFWNAVDALSYIFLFVAFIIRRCEHFVWARHMYSFSLLLMYIRFLQVFLMNRILGPHLIMFKEMLKDLFQFLVIAAIIITGVGIYYHANMWPNHPYLISGSIEDWRVWDILYYPYWQLYGEGFNEFLEGRDLSDCSFDPNVWRADSSIHRCPERDWTMPAVMALYMLISNLLLVNLVIAMFSFTFFQVKADAERLWRYERYRVITEFESRLPTPFNFVWFFVWTISKCLRCNVCYKCNVCKQVQHKSSGKPDRIREIQKTLAKRQTLKSNRKKKEL